MLRGCEGCRVCEHRGSEAQAQRLLPVRHAHHAPGRGLRLAGFHQALPLVRPLQWQEGQEGLGQWPRSVGIIEEKRESFNFLADWENKAMTLSQPGHLKSAECSQEDGVWYPIALLCFLQIVLDLGKKKLRKQFSFLFVQGSSWFIWFPAIKKPNRTSCIFSMFG